MCIDTSFLVALERRDERALKKMRELADRGESAYITAVNVAEFYRGAYGTKDKVNALKKAKDLLDLFVVLDLDYESGRLWGEIAETMKSSSVGDRDLFIACIALSNKQALLTGNRRHFERIPGIILEDW